MNCLRPLFSAVLLTAVLLTASSAAEIKVPLIGLGWQIAFEAPVLRESSVDYPDGAIQFRGNSGRFNVSLFVEPPPGAAANGTHSRFY